MSKYAIIRLQKFTNGSVRGIQSHDLREKDPLTNPDIDKTKTIDNYSLVECTSYNKCIKNKIESLNNERKIRKNAVVMCQFIVTSNKEFFDELTPDEEKRFFIDSLEFISNRYGSNNIVSAIIHKDEKTPHMHVNFTPIKDNKLSAKSIFGKKVELQNLQTEFYNIIGKKWNMERGQTKENERIHYETATFKRITAEEELKRVKLELEKTKKELESVKEINIMYQGLQEGTIQAMKNAEQLSIKRAQEALQKKREQEKIEQEKKAAAEREKARQRKLEEQRQARIIQEALQKKEEQERLEKERLAAIECEKQMKLEEKQREREESRRSRQSSFSLGR